MDLNLNKNMSARRNVTKHYTGPYEPGAAKGGLHPSPSPPPNFLTDNVFLLLAIVKRN